MKDPFGRIGAAAGIAFSGVFMTAAMAATVGLPFPSAPPSTAHAPAMQQVDRRLTPAEARLLRAFHTVLQQPESHALTRRHLLLQIKRNPPVAFVDGYWVTPVDLAAVMQLPAIHQQLTEALLPSPDGLEAAELLAHRQRLQRLTAFAFVANPLRSQLGVTFVGDFPRIAVSNPPRPEVVIVPLKDVQWVVVEYLPPVVPPENEEAECYFFCADKDTWDFDADGTFNALDEDDDNDGIPDRDDDYPYWAGGSDCQCAHQPFVAFSTKFSAGLTSAVLAAYRHMKMSAETSEPLFLGKAPGSEAPMLFRFPPSAMPPDHPRSGCPDPRDPTVRYVDTDPMSCAAIRFRCHKGEEGFSNACGCGCQLRKPELP